MTDQITKMAQDFSRSALDQIAQSARLRAQLLTQQGDGKPWNRTKEVNDAIDTFQQLAAYCERVIAMQTLITADPRERRLQHTVDGSTERDTAHVRNSLGQLIVFDVIDVGTSGSTREPVVLATYPTQLRARNHCRRLEPGKDGRMPLNGWRYLTRARRV